MDETTQLAEIWQDACKRYIVITGVDLQTDSTVIRATSADDLMSILDAQQARLSKFREKKGALWKVLAQTAQGVGIMASIVGDWISSVYPPSGIIFAAVGYLVQAAQNVSNAYDSVIELLEVLKVFIIRLNLHTKHQILPELRDIFVRKLSCLLIVLALSAKMIRNGRALRFIKNIFQGSDGSGIQKQIDELETLSRNEADLIRTLNLTSLYEQSATLASLAATMGANKTALEQFMQMQSSKKVDEDIEDQLQGLKGRLNPELSVQTDFDNISNDLLPGTGDWILSHKSFGEWLGGGSSCLWISGGPGFGKTYLSARIIKHLRELYPQDVEYASCISVVYFFCRESNQRTQLFPVILCTLAYQVARNDSVYRSYLVNTLKRDTDLVAGAAQTWDTLFGNFFSGQEIGSRAYVVIDGLDEAIREGFEGVETFLESFRLFLLSQRNSVARLKVLLMGRPLLDSMVDDILGFHATLVELPGSNESDVVKYVQNQLRRARNLRRVSSELREQILQRLSERTFLWVKLVCKEISSKNRESQIHAALNTFPNDLSTAIRHMLENFSKNNADDIIEDLNGLLMWVTCSCRPWTLGEMEIITAMNSPIHEPILDLERLLRKRYSTFFTLTREDGLGTVDLQNNARRLCGEDDDNEDFEEDLDIDIFDSPKDTTIHISHLVFLEYFRSQGSKSTAVGVDVAKAETRLLIWCLSLLSDEGTNKLDLEVDDWDNDILLMEYACHHWIDHLTRADFNTASREEKRDVAVHLHRLFTDQVTYEGWLLNVYTSPILLTRAFLETTDTTDAIIRWTSDIDETDVRGWGDTIKGDLTELLSVIVKVFRAKWLTGRAGTESFLVIYAYIAKFELYPKENPLKSGPASKLFGEPKDMAYEDILTVVDWIGPEEPRLPGQVLELLVYLEMYDRTLEWHHKAEALGKSPAYPGVHIALAEAYAARNEYVKAAEWGKRAIESFRFGNDAAHLAREVAGWISSAVNQGSDEVSEDDALREWDSAFKMDPTSLRLVHAYLQQLRDWKRYEKYISVVRGLSDVNWSPKTEIKHSFLIECIRRLAPLFHAMRFLQTAARKMGVIPWLVSLYSSAIDAAIALPERLKLAGLVAGLQLLLADVYLFDVKGDECKAVELYEAGLADLASSKASSPFLQGRGVAIGNLAEVYFRRACAAAEQGEEFEPHISALSRTVRHEYGIGPFSENKSQGNIYHPYFDYLISTVRSFDLILGLWYRLRGEHDKARPYFRNRISLALDLFLNDDRTDKGYTSTLLATALRMAGDLRGAKAALHLVGGSAIPDALRVWPNETESSDYTSKSWPPDLAVGYTCCGPCERTIYVPHGMHVCYTCLGEVFCSPCLGKLKRGGLPRNACSKHHQWLYVSRQDIPEILEGKVVFLAEGDQAEVVMDITQWFADLKQKWGIETI